MFIYEAKIKLKILKPSVARLFNVSTVVQEENKQNTNKTPKNPYTTPLSAPKSVSFRVS